MKTIKVVLCLVLTLVIGFTLTANETNAATKKVSLKLSNGATYYGEVKSGKPHGKGVARWGENKVYEGNWVNGKRSGLGKYSLTLITDSTISKTVYNGQWANDQYNGQGSLYESRVSTKPEESEWDKMINVNRGTFKNQKFKYGYGIQSSYMGTFFEYTHSNQLIYYHLDNTNKLFKNTLVADDTRMFEYINKTNKNFVNVYKGIEEDMQSISIGTYTRDISNIYTGTEEEMSGGFYSKTEYLKGKSKTFEKEETDVISKQFDKKMNEVISKHLPVLKPHLSTFRSMVKEYKL
ncbi:hypothetical protein J2W91_004666 [Paenibacillus amylolyticus]|uniref:MORN repeat-containing protein n=1 Tax=Paenibacillus amylolyticus TaxID=1451 RepID=A0AAP5H6L9_PAEAM|nr:hypothetical protein [Paenibacillus amylolyticus]MDR6726160.1 hypothetical protein [Paenibacillus amylolyticus]